MNQSILEIVLAMLSSGGISALVTYICTFKSHQKQAEAEAESSTVDVEQKRTTLRQDQYEYLQKTCDKYIKDYHELEGDFRKEIQGLRSQMDAIMLEKSQAISNKCSEIAELKSKVAYLKGIRCYNFTCPTRIQNNPDKSQNNVHRETRVAN